MTLKERYLKAVAAQLSRDARDDIIAELDDAIMTRMEAREAELGRPLTEADEEAVLRETGHPLNVAAQYGSGPLHVVGPEIYPWWLFGVKVGLLALILINAVSALIQMLVGNVEVGQGIGQALGGIVSGGLTIVGMATIAAFIIERQTVKPAFLREWRVKDLALFELANFDVTRLSRETRTAERTTWRMSPTAKAIAGAAGWAVITLAWAGVIHVGIDIEALSRTAPETGGVDYNGLLIQTWRLLYWPGVIYGVTRVLFEGSKAFQPVGVRAGALTEVAFAVARTVGYVWIWIASPLAPHIRPESLDDFISRARSIPWETPDALAGLLMVMVAAAVVISIWEGLGHLIRVFTGKPRKGC